MCEPGNRPSSKPSVGAMLSNWKTYEGPFASKLRLAVSNNLVKLRTRQSCCGNYGQPGC
jgi:hypothetical protein